MPPDPKIWPHVCFCLSMSFAVSSVSQWKVASDYLVSDICEKQPFPPEWKSIYFVSQFPIPGKCELTLETAGVTNRV